MAVGVRVCPGCGQPLTRRKNEAATDYKKRKFCTMECANKNRYVVPPKRCMCGDLFYRPAGYKSGSWDKRFLCFRCKPKFVPSLDPTRYVPTDRISAIIKRFVDDGIEYEQMTSWTGIAQRRLYDIAYNRTQQTSWETADKILVGMNVHDLWHTELADLYYQGLEFETKNMRDWARRRMGKAACHQN